MPPATASVQTLPAPPIAVADPLPPPKRNLPQRVELGDVDRYSFGLAADRDHVYWVDYHGGGGVFRAKKDGSGREQLAGEQPFTRDVAVDDSFVYWALSTPPGAIMRVAKSGGTPAVFADAQWNPDRVLVHRGHVLWTADPPGVVMRAPAKNGTPKPAVQMSSLLLTIRGDDLFFVDRRAWLKKAPAAGGDAVDIVKLDHVPNDLAVDDGYVYVADAGYPVMPPAPTCKKNVPCAVPSSVPSFPKGEVFRVAIGGGQPQRIAGDLDFVEHVAVDDRWVYFTSNRGLQRMPKDGKGTVVTIDKKLGFASRLLVDEDRIIFQNGQKIVSVAR
jgi:hypothetical protein